MTWLCPDDDRWDGEDVASRPPRASITSCDVLACSWWADRRSPGRSPPGPGSRYPFSGCSVGLGKGQKHECLHPPITPPSHMRAEGTCCISSLTVVVRISSWKLLLLTLNQSDEPERSLGLCYYDPLPLAWSGGFWRGDGRLFIRKDVKSRSGGCRTH